MEEEDIGNLFLYSEVKDRGESKPVHSGTPYAVPVRDSTCKNLILLSFLLLSKVRAHRINGKVLHMIRPWLRDSQQRVKINGSKSKWEVVTIGVPLRSVLGPLLFSIYINHLNSRISSDISKFADDFKIVWIIRSV